jgi:hypothetical protein
LITALCILPLVATIVFAVPATPAVFVSEKFAGALTPGAVAETVNAPAVALAVSSGDTA